MAGCHCLFCWYVIRKSLFPNLRLTECLATGNHAQGVALAGHDLSIACTIVMPLNTPSIKYLNVDRLGAKVVLHGADFDEAKLECARLATLHGLTNIPPFDDPYVIAGQGTVAVEILRQVEAKDLEAIFVCVGGGGLLAGILTYVKEVAPHVKVIGVETYDADALTKSLEAGRRVQLSEVGLFADGTAVREVGEETFRVCAELVDEMILVGNDEVCAAIKDVFGGQSLPSHHFRSVVRSSISRLPASQCPQSKLTLPNRHPFSPRTIRSPRSRRNEEVHHAKQSHRKEQTIRRYGFWSEPQFLEATVHQ